MMCSRGRAELVAGRYRLLTAASGQPATICLKKKPKSDVNRGIRWTRAGRDS
jgi:hypothetical protein